MEKPFLGNCSFDLVGVWGSSYLLSPSVILSCVRPVLGGDLKGLPSFLALSLFICHRHCPPKISWVSDLSEHFTKLPRLP